MAPEDLKSVVTSLEVYNGSFPREGVVPAATVLLNLTPELPGQEQGMFDLGRRMTVARVVSRLLRTNGDDQPAVDTAVREIYGRLNSLSARLELLLTAGYVENVGLELVSPTAADELQSLLIGEVLAADSAALTNEWELFRVLLSPETFKKSAPRMVHSTEPPELHFAVLQSATGSMRGNAMGCLLYTSPSPRDRS